MSNQFKSIVILAHAFAGWALCGAIIGIGREITSLENTLIAHAIGAPVIFAVISLNYFIVSFVIFMDFFVIAFVVEKSFDMFKSILGTWIPFILIFLSTYLTGAYSLKK
ncbi:MAG: hypothetical protein OIN66_09705 [Candidatus Methanoperedens sp.]|nr:hypothetical protein [Candidatus Methanoperedens sp.]